MKQIRYTSTGLAEELRTRLGLKETASVARMIRHYTNEGLLETVGAVNTGTGRKRLYVEDAVLMAGVLLRFNRLGIPVGIMKELLRVLRKHLSAKHSGRGLLEVCEQMKKPCLFLTIPGDNDRRVFEARILEKDAFVTAPDLDAIVIQLARYVPKLRHAG